MNMSDKIKDVTITLKSGCGKCFNPTMTGPLGGCPDCAAVAEIAPGETRMVLHTLVMLFRADAAHPVQGIDYGAFEIELAFVDAHPQFHPQRQRSAKMLFERLRMQEDGDDGRGRFNTGRFIRFMVKNVSDKAQPFAIQLSGKAIY